MKKINHKNGRYLILSILLSLWTYGIFLFPHYSQDTYAKSLFNHAWSFDEGISSGRYTYWLIDSVIFMLFKTRALNNLFTNLLSITFFALAIYYAFSTLIYNDTKRKNELFLISAAIFINPCFVDYFQFPECNIIYSFGLILAIASAKTLYNNRYSRFKQFVQSTAILIITVGIYQPIINYFLLIAILISWKQYIYKLEVDKKGALLILIRNMINCLTVYLLSSVLQLVITSLGNSGGRINRDYLQNINIVINSQTALWTMQSTGNKTYIYGILFCTTVALCVYKFYKKYSNDFATPFFALFTLYVGLYISSFATHIVAEPWLSQRTTSIFYAHIILILYAIYTISESYFNNFIIGITGVLLCFFIYRSNNLAIQNIKTNAHDEQIAYTVVQYINSYELEHQISINNIAVANDKYVTYSYPGILSSYDLNVRVWCYDWAISGMIHQYTKKLYNVIPMEYEKKETIFGDKDWSCFSYEQLYAEGDTLYMMIY